MSTVSAEIHVHAPLKLAYRAFTNSTSLREWLCDVATVNRIRAAACIFGGAEIFTPSGHYLELDENKRVKFQWYSSSDPAPTEVTVTVTEKDGAPLSAWITIYLMIPHGRR